jgi:hypothetical protein
MRLCLMLHWPDEHMVLGRQYFIRHRARLSKAPKTAIDVPRISLSESALGLAVRLSPTF